MPAVKPNVTQRVFCTAEWVKSLFFVVQPEFKIGRTLGAYNGFVLGGGVQFYQNTAFGIGKHFGYRMNTDNILAVNAEK